METVNNLKKISLKSKTDYSRLHNTQNVNEENETNVIHLPENPFNWTNIIADISVSMILAFCVCYLILELHEVVHKNVHDSFFNNIVEAVFLGITCMAMISYMIFFRWRRNLWEEITFDNYSMLLVMCLYGLIEIFYYNMKFFSIYASCDRSHKSVNVVGQFIFTCSLLPFLIINIKNKVKVNETSLKLRTKVTVILSMVGCLMIVTRNSALKFKKEYDKIWNNSLPSSCNRSEIQKIINKKSESAEKLFEIINVNYFVIALILFLNPIFRLNKCDEVKEKVERSWGIQSIIYQMSLVRFRTISVLLSFGIISILSVALYFITGILINTESKNLKIDSYITFNILFICAEVITIIYEIFYYFGDIKTWKFKETRELKSDQYFNFITSLAQLAFIGVLLLNTCHSLINENDTAFLAIFKIQIGHYLVLVIQILLQSSCLHEASQRVVKIYSSDDSNTWNYMLIPPLLIASFNVTSMITIVAYVLYPGDLMFSKDYNNVAWVAWSNFILPLCILHRFHGFTFFINLTATQW